MAFSFGNQSPLQQTTPLIQQNYAFPQQQQQQQVQQQMYLFTNEKAPASYQTTWSDLHPESQKLLLEIEERILEYRVESQRLDQCSRLYDTSVSNDAFELDACHIIQELGGISTAMEREKILLQELMSVVKGMMRNTEVAVWSFMMLHPRFVHTRGSTTTHSSTPPISGAMTHANPNTQQKATSVVPVIDYYSGIPRRPSPFLQHTVARFEKYLAECRQWIEELEQLLLRGSDENGNGNTDLTLLDSLPAVMSNVHDFFVHVAAKVETLHQHMESMRAAYLADQRRRGEGNDPFLEADRRETAKQEVAARRVHPTLHLPSLPQPLTQVAGLFACSSTPSSSFPGASSSTPIMAGGTSSGFSLFNTPTSASTSTSNLSSSLFATPNLQATPFASSRLSQSSSLFGTPTTPSLFGSSSTPSLLGSAPSIATPAFGSLPFTSTPAIGPGTGLSFGATTKSTKPKARTARR
ncbi:nuclear pore complex protein NUP58 isoform X1 [Amborella trichopoda]|uniref:nuclear pore complex protein NUP58 isoform X1 n=1 Tax=Amborella trichopoda TaxID=13333 RepID=UPI0005D326EE|nr:nuclear pore complex protein NUP58 isoform X1 [Amborella trichopoda]XP_020530357.1 nuclear pore complex protein NUP58 isoform X1 [Amborella trichopoda]|eukprot:XP_011627745.1 nuclear pore complex protein NUP58 isoform X1 [Amborella trichopoda]